MQDREPNEDSPSERSRADAATSAAYLRHAGAGLQFALTFLGLGLVGWWVDQQLGSEPWLLIAGIVLGAAGGMYSLASRLDALPRSRSGDSTRPRK
ncbi:MAG: AtpZ/AtpI family protein [Planctomycetes bacterium]|nr:AtpZ/AtpI family protein [Planctomycetota bacterium]